MMANKNKTDLVIILLFICVAFTSNKANAQRTFRETLDIHLNAIRKADIKSFEPTVSDSLIHISPMGEINQSKTQFIKLHQEWFKRKNWKWEGVIVKEESNDSMGYALVNYAYLEKGTAGNVSFKTKCFLILIFQKTDKGWQLVHDQNTTIPD
jgi:ketosteroid isomerase-like protein